MFMDTQTNQHQHQSQYSSQFSLISPRKLQSDAKPQHMSRLRESTGMSLSQLV